MGYKHVEHANYNDRKFYGYAAKEFKKMLDDLGMQMPSGHTVMGKPHWDDVEKRFYRPVEIYGRRCCNGRTGICYQSVAG